MYDLYVRTVISMSGVRTDNYVYVCSMCNLNVRTIVSVTVGGTI